MSSKSKKTKQFNVLMAPAELEMLQELAETLGVSAGLAVRLSVKYHHQHLCLRAPRCASGQVCYVPHLHLANPAQVPQVAGGVHGEKA